MQRYWYLTAKDRAALTRDEVQTLANIELMEKGVLRVEPPVLEPVEELKIPTATMYTLEVKGAGRHGYYSKTRFPIAFQSQEAAGKFLVSGGVYFLQDEYMSHGDNLTYSSPAELSVTPCEVATYQDVLSHKALICEMNARKEKNAQLEREYREALKGVEVATAELWADWHDACAKKLEMERLQKVAEDYMVTAGSTAIAMKFLVKAVGREKVLEMLEWTGLGYACPEEEGEPHE